MIIKWPWTRKQLLEVRPDMTRRRFLTALAAVPVAAALAPELVDMLKPPKLISLPPRLAMSRYLTGNDAWFLMQPPPALRYYDRKRIPEELKPGPWKWVDAPPMNYEHVQYALGFQIVGETDEDLTDYNALARHRHEQLVASMRETVAPYERAAADMLNAPFQYTENTVQALQHIVSYEDIERSVNALPAAAEDLARDIVTSPIDLVKRILRT